MKRAWTSALAAGAVVGFLLPAIALGVGTSHLVCVVGGITGWSGVIATPTDIALAPPGGAVNYSSSLNTVWSSTDASGLTGASEAPLNWSTVDMYQQNWTFRSESTQRVLGWGASPQCPGVLTANGGPTGEYGACFACLIANATPSGVGNRLLIPQPVVVEGTPLASVNLSYAPSPAGSLSWTATSTGVVSLSESAGLRELPVSVEPFYELGQFIGLGITLLQQQQLSFGVPIHFLNGSTVVVPASLPTDWPVGPAGATSFSLTLTYVLPASTDQGSWAVYLAGSGGAISAAGLLFEQTSGIA